jgi:very-short-patch-repair endonuclease
VDFSQFFNFEKTVLKFGSPVTSKSKIIFDCFCGSESIVDLNSLKARVRRNKNNPDFKIQCDVCSRHNSNRFDPEILPLISINQTTALHGVPKNKHDLVIVPCSKCSNPHSLKVSSLKIRIWQYRKLGQDYSYICKNCKSGGITPVESDFQSFCSGEIPKNKKDKVKVICFTCKSEYCIRFDSLKNTIRKHKKTSSESFQYLCLSCYSESEKAKKIRSKAVQTVTSSGFKSKLEIATENILKGLKINFSVQHPIGYYLFDFFLPENKILIEVQGEYWHGTDNGIRRDSAKHTYISEYFPDHKFLYLHERDFFNPKIIEKKILEVLDDEKEIIQNQFEFKDVKVIQLIDRSFVNFLNSFHYAQFGRKEKHAVGAFLGNELIAVCKFAPIVRKEVATSIGLSSKDVVELDRFCIHPNYQKKNFASWFLSRCTKSVFEKFELIQKIVSFADSTFDHKGTIYKASNWEFISETSPSYFYLSPEGFVIHKKTLYEHAQKMSMKEADYVAKFGYDKRFSKKKYKFVFSRSQL